MNNRNLKVRILAECTYPELQYSINDYLEGMDREKIIDIKYQATEHICSAMIIYKEG